MALCILQMKKHDQKNYLIYRGLNLSEIFITLAEIW